MYIARSIQNQLETNLLEDDPLIPIIAGVVGAGKTTLIRNHLLRSGGRVRGLLGDKRFKDNGLVFYGGQLRVRFEGTKKLVFFPYWML